MSNPLTDFFHWVKSLFTRRGMLAFLQSYQGLAVHVIQSILSDPKFYGKKMIDFRDDAFDLFVKLYKAQVGLPEDAEFDKPGTWVTIALNLAHDIAKAAKGDG